MKFTTWYEMSTRFVNPITYKYLLISTNIVQLFDFVDFALRVKKLHIVLIFCYFLWYFSVYFNFSREIWTKISSKFTKKWTFELNWTFLFSSSNTLTILNYFLVNSLTKGQHFQNPTPYGKWMHIIFWDMSKHEICRH